MPPVQEGIEVASNSHSNHSNLKLFFEILKPRSFVILFFALSVLSCLLVLFAAVRCLNISDKFPYCVDHVRIGTTPSSADELTKALLSATRLLLRGENMCLLMKWMLMQ